MANTPAHLLTLRDIDILQGLERSPLTARQILRLSETFHYPFTNERKVRARMQELAESGQVRCWPYVVAGRGQPVYYTLSRRGHSILYGGVAPQPGKRSFQAIGIARQQHAFALAEFVVHTAVAAHREGITFTGFCRENSVCLSTGEDHVYPDCGFVLQVADDLRYQFFVELDNGTERIHSTKDAESWERKIRVYEAVQDRSENRFRVLVVVTRESERLTRILEKARAQAVNPLRSLFYGIALSDYLAEGKPLDAPCFLNHFGNASVSCRHTIGPWIPGAPERFQA